MKTKLTLLLSIVILYSISCKKEKETPEERLLVKLLTRTIQVQHGSTSFTDYTYDDQRRLKTIKESYGSQTYIYEGKSLSAIELTYPSAGKSLLSFTDGKPVKATTTFPDKTITIGYIYKDELVSEVHESQNGVVVNLEKYTYANHNITRRISDYGQGIVTENRIYGTRKSKFYNISLDYVIGVEAFDRYSHNELLESKIDYGNGSSLTTKNTYTYDEDGFPKTMVTINTSSLTGPVGESRYTFEYEMFK